MTNSHSIYPTGLAALAAFIVRMEERLQHQSCVSRESATESTPFLGIPGRHLPGTPSRPSLESPGAVGAMGARSN